MKERLRLILRFEITKELEKNIGLMIGKIENNEETIRYLLYEDYIKTLGKIMKELGETNSKKNVIFDFIYNGNKI